jgi:hypothetical protein
MQIENYLKEAAEKLLNAESAVQLPAQLEDGAFYLASAEDETILAHAAIKDAQGVEYKIGTKK